MTGSSQSQISSQLWRQIPYGLCVGIQSPKAQFDSCICDRSCLFLGSRYPPLYVDESGKGAPNIDRYYSSFVFSYSGELNLSGTNPNINLIFPIVVHHHQRSCKMSGRGEIDIRLLLCIVRINKWVNLLKSCLLSLLQISLITFV